MRLARQFALVGFALAVLALWLTWRMAASAALFGDAGAWQRAMLLSLVFLAGFAAAAWLLATRVVRPLVQLAAALDALARGMAPAALDVRGTRDVREMQQLVPQLLARLEHSAMLAATLRELHGRLREQDAERVRHIQQVRAMVESAPRGLALRAPGWQLESPHWKASEAAALLTVLRGADGEDVEVWVEPAPGAAAGGGDERAAALGAIAGLAQQLLQTPLDLEQQCRVQELLAAADMRGAGA